MVKQRINAEIRKVQGFDDNVTLGISIPKGLHKIIADYERFIFENIPQ